MNSHNPNHSSVNNKFRIIKNAVILLWLLAVTITIIYILIQINIIPISNKNIEGIWEIKASSGIKSYWYFKPDGSFTYINNQDQILTTGQYRFLYRQDQIILIDDYDGSQEEINAKIIDNNLLYVSDYSLLDDECLYYSKSKSNSLNTKGMSNYKRIKYSSSKPITADDIQKYREEYNQNEKNKANYKP